ncbi:amidohydrolase family protein [Granulicella tundricola]|uniref:Amidohydrolase 2 n=1 Tax=Granulicella tundricola (strain ATCC BAA-1859 / DSM 23138 / MP5ACTX9) TaxID=1198114 RepID=E8X720_GRATM|nr:amidohydrolase family protein [Granulicella tundricola]ADW71129.1 amidohydrolase 2 [Granulicella tundricola MP5ACTX9]
MSLQENAGERIDAHHHLWRYDEAEFGWIDDTMNLLRRDFLAPDLTPLLQVSGVTGTIAVQARQTIEETHWLLTTARQFPWIRGVVGWLPISDVRFEDHLDLLTAEPMLKGLRHIVQAEPPGFLDDPGFNRGIRQLTRCGLTYDLLIFSKQLEEALRFVRRHPQQSFVIDHIAKPNMEAVGFAFWSRLIREFADLSNVTCKISGMVTETRGTPWNPEFLKPYFDVVLETFGPSRLMTGTDWPVLTMRCGYRQWWQTVEEWIAPLSAFERSNILGETALRVYHTIPAQVL